jgi:glyoxylase-like metal-dependent hydrolase (beta-lactamase superfamily II)
MSMHSVSVGDLELVPILDAVGLLASYAEVYPEVPLQAWEPYRALYPELFSGDDWRLPCKCFLVRTGETTILVDTGVGPPGLWDWTAEREGELPEGLARLGVRHDEVDIVFLTHLHIDHVGWNTDLEGVACFPRARYVVPEDSLAFARSQDGRAHVQRCILALQDRFETVTSTVELAPGVSAFEAAGHYPGHMALRVTSGGQNAVLMTDTAVHPALLHEPDWVYVADGDPAVCAETRRALLPELVDRDVLVACGHYPGSGIGRVVTRGGRVVWEESRV